MDWEFDGEEFDEETKIREETRKIMELPELAVSATCVRVPVLVGHSEAVWIETEQPLSAERATELLSCARACALDEFPTPGKAAGQDDVLVGRIRPDRAASGLSLFLVGDNLRKGAALNAIQIAELVLAEASWPLGQSGVSSACLGPGHGHRLRRREDLAQAGEHRRAAAGQHRLEPAEVQAGTSSTRPALRSVRKPRSARKSRGKTVRWTRKRSYIDSPSRYAYENVSSAAAPRSRASPIAARNSDCITHGVEGSARYAHVTSTASLRRRARRQLGGARKERRGAVLHRPEEMAVAVDVERPPRAPLRLGPLAPAVLLHVRPGARLPPHAFVADRRRLLQRRARQARDLRRHLAPDLVDEDVHGGRRRARHPLEVLGDPLLELAPERRDGHAGARRPGGPRWRRRPHR